MTHRTPDVRRALIERVGRTLQHEGVPRARVASAVDAVLDRLDRPGASAGRSTSVTASMTASVVAAFTALGAPDLASRVRRGLEQANVAVLDIGSATAGRHTVVTARVPAAARESLGSVAGSLGAALSVHADVG